MAGIAEAGMAQAGVAEAVRRRRGARRAIAESAAAPGLTKLFLASYLKLQVVLHPWVAGAGTKLYTSVNGM